MTQERAYDQLLKMMSGDRKYGKIDHRVLHMLALLDRGGANMDKCVIPMQVVIREGSLDKIKGKATIFSVIDELVGARATIAQLIELLQIQEVIQIVASEPKGEDE